MEDKPIIQLNVLAANLDNAKAVCEAGQGKVLVGLIVKDYPSVAAATDAVLAYQEAGVPVSIGLGNGDASAWRNVFDVAIHTGPAHVNQVFPAAGYTLAGLHVKGHTRTVVNALIRPSGIAGKVIIATGPLSQSYPQVVSCDVAAAMLADIGVPSVKFYPVDGDQRLAEIADMVQACVRHGITVFEPTGGLDRHSLVKVVDTCIKSGARHVIPHVYSSIIDKATGWTRTEDVRDLIKLLN
jgi:2-dehydro-3-deoxy-phosphogluconate aldolase